MTNSLLFSARPTVAALFAQQSMSRGQMWLAAMVVLAVMVAFIFIILLAKYYKRCPSNRVLVIYGKVGQRRGGHTASTAGRRSSGR